MLVCVSEILHSVQDDKIKAPFHNGDRGRPDSFGAASVVLIPNQSLVFLSVV